MKIIPAIFEEHEIRRLYDEETETWFFSVVDIIQVLTQQPDYQAARNYWKVLKNRLAKEGSQSVTNCNRLKLPAADGKSYLMTKALPPPQPSWRRPGSGASICREPCKARAALAACLPSAIISAPLPLITPLTTAMAM